MAGWLTVGSPLDEVLDAFRALLDERAQVPAERDVDRGNFRCTDCEDCDLCRFCNSCTDCEDCTYCDECSACSSCTHCNGCERCTQTTHSAWSSACKDSSYVTLSLDCSGCVQCFACVGLRNEEFCILNEKLPRKTYFSRVAALRGAFEERIASGWRPPWLLEDEEFEDDDEDDDADYEEPEGDYEEPEAAVIVDDPGPADSSASLRLEALWSSEMPSEMAPVENDIGPSARPPNRTESTVDTGEPLESAQRHRDASSWNPVDVRRPTAAARDDDTQSTIIPEPPPFGADDETRVSKSAAPRARVEGEEPTRRRDQATFDRYGWSAQTEGTPESRGWTSSNSSAKNEPVEHERPQWPAAEDIAEPPRSGRNHSSERESSPDRPSARSRRPWNSDSELKPPLPRWTPEDRERETRPSMPRSESGDLPHSGWSPDEEHPARLPTPRPPSQSGHSSEPIERRARQPLRTTWSEDEGERETRPRAPSRRNTWADAEVSELPTKDRRRPSRWGNEQRANRWLPESPLSEPERRRMESDTSLKHRRRETAASPSARPVESPGPRRVATPEATPVRGSDLLERDLDAWGPYEEAQRNRLGPEDQTEPDAPVARRGSSRAELSGSARASKHGSGAYERGSGALERGGTPERGAVPERSGPRPVKVSLGAGRRPERPRPPEPRERGGLMRGRPPARPVPASGRQNDAPSLRRARRPSRSGEDTTSKYPAARGTDGEDPGTD